jgi:hypothetical protein
VRGGLRGKQELVVKCRNDAIERRGRMVGDRKGKWEGGDMVNQEEESSGSRFVPSSSAMVMNWREREEGGQRLYVSIESAESQLTA